MRALWLEDQAFQLRDDLPRPDPPPGEALIRVRLAGVCGTDLELSRGYYPYSGIPGHEFVGEVVSAQADTSWVGRRVVGEINAVCHRCQACQAGRPPHCENRTVLGIVERDGAFAEYLTLPLENLHPVPEKVSDESAVFTEPLAAALQIQEQVRVRPSDRVLLVGAGRLGLLIAQTLALTGCALGVVARRARARGLLSSWGLQPLEEAQVQTGRFDLVIEASGSPGGLDLARRAVRPRGVLVLKSTYAGKHELDFSALVVDEVSLVGSRCGPFAPAMALMAQGQVDPSPLIDARYPLESAIQAVEHAARPGTLKVLIAPGGR